LVFWLFNTRQNGGAPVWRRPGFKRPRQARWGTGGVPFKKDFEILFLLEDSRM